MSEYLYLIMETVWINPDDSSTGIVNVLRDRVAAQDLVNELRRTENGSEYNIIEIRLDNLDWGYL